VSEAQLPPAKSVPFTNCNHPSAPPARASATRSQMEVTENFAMMWQGARRAFAATKVRCNND